MSTVAITRPEPARGTGLAGVVEIVRRRRVLAVLPFLFVLTAVASLAFFLPSLWTAKALILVDRQQIPEAFVKPTVTGDLEAQLLMLSQEVLSGPRLAAIARKYGLYPEVRGGRSEDLVVDRMRGDIRIEAQSDQERRARGRSDARTVAFTVAYTATDPRIATAVANELSDLYVQANFKYRERQAVGTSQFLESQLREVRDKLQDQERRITAYKERYMGELPEQRDVNLRTLERLQQQLQLAYENNRRSNERRQLITQALAEIDQTSGLSASAAGPSVTPAESTAARLMLLRQELAQMQSRYNDKYPDVVAMKEQIEGLEARLAQEQAAAAAQPKPTATKRDPRRREAPQNPYVVSLLQQLDQANVDAKTTSEEIANLNAQIATYQRRLENTPKREQELAIITRDYEANKELLRSLQAKLGEAGIAAELEQRQKGEQFRIIDPATIPERPAGPNRLRLLLVGVVLALGASAIAVVLAEQVDTSYRSVDEVRASLPVPVLSIIPKITTDRDRMRLARRRQWATAAVAIGLLLVMGSSFAVAHRNVGLVTLLTSTDTVAGKR
jgi:polysaccharide chain length determinant protein (PEP-CTERM system associated)